MSTLSRNDGSNVWKRLHDVKDEFTCPSFTYYFTDRDALPGKLRDKLPPGPHMGPNGIGDELPRPASTMPPPVGTGRSYASEAAFLGMAISVGWAILLFFQVIQIGSPLFYWSSVTSLFLVWVTYNMDSLLAKRFKKVNRDVKAIKAASTIVTHDDFPSRMPREKFLAATTTRCSRSIARSRAWNSDHGALHRIQFDLVENARQIVYQVHKITALRDAIGGAPEGEGAVARAAAAQHEQQTKALNFALDSLAVRVEALIRYQKRIDALDGELAALDQLTQGQNVNSEISAMLATVVNNTDAAAHLDQLSNETQSSVDAIKQITNLLHADAAAISTALVEAETTERLPQ